MCVLPAAAPLLSVKTPYCLRPHICLCCDAVQAQCTSPMHLDTALALIEEMRSRNIQPNTHTYSSLLNVCVKAGQLNMALGVYNEVRYEPDLQQPPMMHGEHWPCVYPGTWGVQRVGADR
jgi:pentatricopeptide repeat protein